MNPLLLLILIPALTVIAIAGLKELKQVRVISAVGMGTQLLFSFYLVYAFYALRQSGNTDAMLFVSTSTCVCF